MIENIISTISINLIPMFITILSPIDSFFIKLFIRNKKTLYDHIDEIKYLLCGQSVLISPLSSLILISNFLLGIINKTWFLIILTLYLIIYILLLSKLLRMSVETFSTLKQPYRFIYRYIPLIICLVSFVLSLCQNMSSPE